MYKLEIASKIVQNGKFRVFENGDIYRIKNGKEALASINWASRNRRYAIVSFTENGKQKHYYVHRLVAEAFCENPNNYPHVNHLNGDTSINIPSNLEWCTASQNVIHAYKIGLINQAKYTEPCQICGQPTHRKTGICPICRKNILRQANEDSKISKLREALSSVNMELLNPRQLEIISLRLEGKTFQEIGDKFQLTKQRIDQIIEGLIIKSISPIKKSYLVKKEHKRLLAKIAKKEERINKALDMIEEIEKEISSLKESIDRLQFD